MNIYVTVEGERGERKIYEKWIPLLNPQLSYVESIYDVSNNNFAIMAGFGQPFYFELIRNAIDEVNDVGDVDRLIISIDSEEMSFEEKYEEVLDEISTKTCSADIRIIIQHFCFETWALGNRRVGPRQPKTRRLLEFKNVFNVLSEDPEGMPGCERLKLNRAQFAEKYLRTMLNDKFRNLTYTKSNREVVEHHNYFSQVISRHQSTGHIDSFSTFIDAFT
jgi:hypothetical protein